MDTSHTFIANVWREAYRHIDIEVSIQTIADILAPQIPIDRVYMLSLDWERGVVVPRAVGKVGGGASRLPPPYALRARDRGTLREWVKNGKMFRQRVGDKPHELFEMLTVGKPMEGGWLIGPLSSEHGAAGALLLRSSGQTDFKPTHARIAELLIEPLSAALENDRRLHELNALREAAEADKRSALSRLGRDDLVDTLIGSDGGLRPVLERVDRVARSDIPVLIFGETGSGKEVIARAIHERSDRAKGPFIRINCGAIPPELIDSELFGHEKGAFTGAIASRRGWFERADEGTLLLDEIGELPLPAQVRLLRVLQEGMFERVGGEKPIHVRVRIIAATHRDLPAMVQEGRFREDLWYRIAGFPIVLPPLRERKEDIPALAKHFAERAGKRFGLRVQSPNPADLAVLNSYNWPGNIRELASVIDRAAILGDGVRLEVAKALGVTRDTETSAPTPLMGGVTLATGGVTLDDAMKRHIEAALIAARGRVEGERGIAKLLKINPHTLRARMRKLGIAWAQYR